MAVVRYCPGEGTEGKHGNHQGSWSSGLDPDTGTPKYEADVLPAVHMLCSHITNDVMWRPELP
jgi:hypothetical protein